VFACSSRYQSPSTAVRRTASALSLILLFNLAAVEKANAMFDMFRLCMFSAVKGSVRDHGQPVKGARIVRTYEWGWGGDKEERDETITNDSGEFVMPAVFPSQYLEPFCRMSRTCIKT
jgi:hypothetical protein